MQRVRLLFALVSIALAVPCAMLVQRGFESARVERQLQQRVLAERVFDEMERALSTFLATEEERPFEQYRFFYEPEGAVGSALVRSPLSRADARERWPFVVGHFQVDPDRSVHTPLEPRADELARAREGWSRSAELDDRIANVRAAVEAGFGASSPDQDVPEGVVVAAPPVPEAQAPGTTVPIGDAKAQLAKVAGEKKEAGAASEAAGTYEVFRQFNRAAESRKERGRKVALREVAVADAAEPFASEAPLAAPEAEELPEPLAPRGAEARPQELAAAEAFDDGDAVEADLERRGPAAGSRIASRAARDERVAAPESPRSFGRLAHDAAPPPAPGRGDAPAAKRSTSVRVAVDPLLGRQVPGGERLLLSRTVLVGDRGFRQGVVLDRPALERWLRSEVLDSAGISRAELSFDSAESAGSNAYRHRFAEPFDALHATLVLPPLAGGAGSRTAQWLSVALFGALAAGLFALYRMVAVTVGFAERRSNFVASVSHELKTPLTAIRMYSEMLRDGMVPPGEKQREYFGTITAESERLSRLIQNVLEFSRLERGSREVELVVGALGPVVEEAAEMLRPHAQREGFLLEVDVPASLPAVRFDRDALVQVLFNLVDNALKYARDARDRTIRIEAREESGGVRLAVRDAGPGVPESQLSRIFEPFYRGGSELTRTAQGAGIGLALVRELADRMGAVLRGANLTGGGFEVSLRFAAD